MSKITDDLAERGVEVLMRIAFATLSLDDASFISGWVHDARNALRASGGVTIVVDALAQEIRRLDGDNSLGAGQLAEALMPFLSSLEASPAPVNISAETEHVRGDVLTVEPAPVSERDALIDYVLQDALHNRLTPRVVDIAYTAFTLAKEPNKEDGGPSDWFTDTKPHVDKMIADVRAALAAKGGQ